MTWQTLGSYLATVNTRLRQECDALSMYTAISATDATVLDNQVKALRQHLDLVEMLKTTAKP